MLILVSWQKSPIWRRKCVFLDQTSNQTWSVRPQSTTLKCLHNSGYHFDWHNEWTYPAGCFNVWFQSCHFLQIFGLTFSFWQSDRVCPKKSSWVIHPLLMSIISTSWIKSREEMWALSIVRLMRWRQIAWVRDHREWSSKNSNTELWDSVGKNHTDHNGETLIRDTWQCMCTWKKHTITMKI